MNACEEVSGGFFVACCDAPKVFDVIEEAFDEIALGIKRDSRSRVEPCGLILVESPP